MCSALSGGAVEAARRCKTDAIPLNSAVSRANETDTTRGFYRGRNRRSRRLLVTTNIELAAMAAAAIIGLR